MTNAFTTPTTLDDPAAGLAARPDSRSASAARHLRLVLRANAFTSALSGAVGLIGASYWSDRLGFDNVAVTAVVAVGLLVFAVDVWFGSKASDAGLRRHALLVSLADVSWVVASVIVVVLGILTTFGTVVTLVVAAAVADFAVAQLWFRRKL